MLLKVNELHALTDEADRALWRFLAETDLVSTVVAGGRSPSDRLPWLLTNARAAVPSEIGEGLWVRLFDVRRALEARRYEREGELVLEVVDAEVQAPIRVVLEASSAGAACRPTDRSPDLTLPVAALGAAYLGGTRLRDAVIATGVDQHREGALAAADALFRTADEPWCSTFF
jgi:predicted acetyltransferase